MGCFTVNFTSQQEKIEQIELAYQVWLHTRVTGTNLADIAEACGILRSELEVALENKEFAPRERSALCTYLHITKHGLSIPPVTSPSFAVLVDTFFHTSPECDLSERAKEISKKMMKEYTKQENFRNLSWLSFLLQAPEYTAKDFAPDNEPNIQKID